MKWPSSRSAGSCSYSRDGQNSLNTSVYLALFHWSSRGRTQSPSAPPSPQFVFVHPPPPHTPRLEGLWVELGGGSQVPHTAAVFSMGSRGSWPAPSGVWGRLGQRLRGREGGAEPRPCAHSEVKLSVVTYLTNSIVDEILQELYNQPFLTPFNSQLSPFGRSSSNLVFSLFLLIQPTHFSLFGKKKKRRARKQFSLSDIF